MTPDSRTTRLKVLLAAVLVVALGVVLVVGLEGLSAGGEAAVSAPAASVPAPRAVAPADLEPPCWSCPMARSWPVAFRTDLDVLAPLGTGPANAALWFKDFFKAAEGPGGPRLDEAIAADERRIQGPDDWGLVLPAADPLLIEAAPWADQATMRFYPDIFAIEGFRTQVPSLLIMLTFARSWAAWGATADDPARGLEECRRAIRLGRLLRQEDAVIINDLVGLASIHLGARGVYRIAVRTGDLELALAASAVLSEVAPQRLFTAQRVTTLDLGSPLLRPSAAGAAGAGPAVELPDSKIDEIAELATNAPERRFRGEGLLHAHAVTVLGSGAQRRRMLGLLESAATGEDPILSALARWCLDNPPTPEMLEVMFPAAG